MADYTDTDGNGKVRQDDTGDGPTTNNAGSLGNANPNGGGQGYGPAGAISAALGSTLGTMTSGTVANKPASPRRIVTG